MVHDALWQHYDERCAGRIMNRPAIRRQRGLRPSASAKKSMFAPFLIHALLPPERCLTQRRIKAFPFVPLEDDEKLANECIFQLKTSEFAWVRTTTGKNYC
jgi:hypothetical protein